MITAEGSFSRKYQHVVDRDTGEAVVIKPRKRNFQLDPTAVFYDPEKHDGRLTCGNCALPDIDVIEAYYQRGGHRIGQHFKIAHGQRHHPQCNLATEPLDDETHTERDATIGPVIFLNGSLIDLAYDFKRAAQPVPEAERLIYRTPDNKFAIRDERLEPRQRHSARNVDDFFRVMRRKDMTLERLTDSWIIFGESAISWDKFFIRGKRLRDMTTDLLTPEADKHPVLLHVRMKKPAKLEHRRAGDRLKIALPTFTMSHPETGEEVTVHAQAYVRNKDIFPAFQNFAAGETKEFFALTTPYFSEYIPRRPGEPNLRFVSDAEAARDEPKKPRHIYVHFNLHPHFLEWKTMAELAAEMGKKPSFAAAAKANDNPAPG